MNNICVVIPMKSPERGKQRLAGFLTDQSRKELSLKLFKNTLRFFRRNFPSLSVLVVSDSINVLNLSKTYGAKTLFDDGAKGLNGALEYATEWVMCSGFFSQLIIPSDIPKLKKREITSLVNAANHSNVVVALAKDGGTNGLLTTPPNAISFQYGDGSSAKHINEAKSKKLPVHYMNFKYLSLDIDYSEDLKIAALDQPKFFKDWHPFININLKNNSNDEVRSYAK